jgi:hypothetical protein
MEAQWTGVNALGLALAYRDWRRGKTGRGAVWLILFAGVAKPHLALGVVAFALGWRERRVVQGAVLGAIAVAGLSLVAVGFAGVAGFVALIAQSSTQFSPNTFVGLYGLFGTVFGSGALAQVLWLGGAVVACVLAWFAGAAVRRDRKRLEIGLTVAALVTILAAPHVYVHDMVLLAPMFVWAMADARVRDQSSPTRTRRTTIAVVACWSTLSCAELLSLAGGPLANLLGGAVAAGAVIPEVLVVLTAVAVIVTLRGSRRTNIAAHDAPARPHAGELSTSP